MKMRRKLLSVLLGLAILLPTVAVPAGAAQEPTALDVIPTQGQKQAETARTSVVVKALEDGEIPVFTTQEVQEGTPVVDDGTTLAPMMGWSSWNFFQGYINETDIMAVANALVESGLADAGYKYVNLDDNWHSTIRDPEDGTIMWDLGNFPSGAGLVDKLHDMGLRVGLYSCSGDLTCEDVTGSYKFEKSDAQTFADWGIDYLKYDFCHQTLDDVLNAPNVDYIGITKLNEERTAAVVPEVRYEAEEAELAGNLTTGEHKDNVTGIEATYVTGLSKNGGTITFTVNVDEDGEYLMTIGCPKNTGNNKTYLEAMVNDDRYEVYFEKFGSDKSTYRRQLYVNLNAGENTIVLSHPVTSQKDDAIRRFSNMRNALNEATEGGNPIYFNVCEWGTTGPWTWVPGIGGNSWRTSGDIEAKWDSVLYCYESSVTKWQYQQPGAYNDPDMLQVGNGDLTEEENKSHFALWCMLSAPLQLGNDVRTFVSDSGEITPEAQTILDIVTNEDLIAINQDLPRLQCKRISTENNVDILVKPLLNQETSEPEVAILFLNKGDTETTASVDLTSLQDDRVDTLLPEADVYAAKELYTKDTEIVDEILSSGTIPSHGVKVFRVSAADGSALEKFVTLKVESAGVYPAGGTGEVTAILKNIGQTDINNATVKLTSSSVDGQTISVTEPSEPVNIPSGQQAEVKFTITLPELMATDRDAYADSYELAAVADFTYEGDSDTSQKTVNTVTKVSIPVVTEDSTDVMLGDANWMKSTTGWEDHPNQRNQSIEGNSIRLDGISYTSGIGAHAPSDIDIYVGGIPCLFTATVGIDEETSGGSVTFRILADGEEIYATKELGTLPPEQIACQVPAGTQILTLRADSGDGNSFDHADWAEAKLTVGADIPESYTITISPSSNGTISSNPTDSVMEGGNVRFTFTPEKGYYLDTAIVNGTDVTDDVENNVYVLQNVTENVTVEAIFAESPENIALKATATVDHPEVLWTDKHAGQVNDGLYEDPGVFGFKHPLTENSYFDLTWDNPVNIDSAVLKSYWTRAQGPSAFTISVRYEGSEDWVVVANATKDYGDILNAEQQSAEVVFENTLEKVKAMRVLVTASTHDIHLEYDRNNTCAAITEFEVYGTELCTVTLHKNNGEENEVVYVPNGTIPELTDPTKENASFDGWYTDEALTVPYDYAAVTESLDLYAKWVDASEQVTVTLHKNNGEENEIISVPKGTVPELPTPTKENASFDGWYLDEECTIPYDNAAVTESLDLYAKWVDAPEQVTVNFPKPEHGKITVSIDGMTSDTGSITIDSGKDVTVTFTPDAGYEVSTATVNGTTVTPDANGQYIIPNVTENVDITAIFTYVGGSSSGGGSSVTRYTITATATAGGSISPSGTVRVNRNADETFTMKAQEGYELADVLADGKSVGAVERYTFEEVRKSHTILAIFEKTIDDGDTPLGDLPFSDVDVDDWYAEAVGYVVKEGLMAGTSETTFGPATNLTRSMMAQVMFSMEKGVASAGNSFVDVPAGAWYADAVNWASANGIMSGYGDGRFGPDDPITREQIALLMYNYAKLKDYDMTATADLSLFADNAAISSWASEAMEWAVGSGLLSGKDGNMLDPTGVATRAEVATILMRFAEIGK